MRTIHFTLYDNMDKLLFLWQWHPPKTLLILFNLQTNKTFLFFFPSLLMDTIWNFSVSFIYLFISFYDNFGMFITCIAFSCYVKIIWLVLWEPAQPVYEEAISILSYNNNKQTNKIITQSLQQA